MIINLILSYIIIYYHRYINYSIVGCRSEGLKNELSGKSKIYRAKPDTSQLVRFTPDRLGHFYFLSGLIRPQPDNPNRTPFRGSFAIKEASQRRLSASQPTTTGKTVDPLCLNLKPTTPTITTTTITTNCSNCKRTSLATRMAYGIYIYIYILHTTYIFR